VALAVLACGAGCQGVRAAFQQRVEQVYRDAVPPEGDGSFQVGFAMGVEALERLALDRVRAAAADETLPPTLAIEAPLPGLASFAVTPAWDDAVIRIRPAAVAGPSALELLAATSGTARASAGPLAMEQPVRLSLRAVVEIEAQVSDSGGVLQVRARIADPEQVRLRIMLEAAPPGMDLALSAAAEAHLRMAMRERPPDPWLLFQVGEERAPEPLPLADVVVGCFPGGRSTVYLGVQTSLPVTGPPAVDAAALDPGDADWVLQVDQEPLQVMLARAALDGRLGGTLGGPSDRLDLLGLELDEEGFVADLRLWRVGPVPGTVDLRAGGELGFDGERLELTVRTLEQAAGRPVAQRKLPWTVRIEIPPLPLSVAAVETAAGALVIRGGVGEEETR